MHQEMWAALVKDEKRGMIRELGLLGFVSHLAMNSVGDHWGNKLH